MSKKTVGLLVTLVALFIPTSLQPALAHTSTIAHAKVRPIVILSSGPVTSCPPGYTWQEGKKQRVCYRPKPGSAKVVCEFKGGGSCVAAPQPEAATEQTGKEEAVAPYIATKQTGKEEAVTTPAPTAPVPDDATPGGKPDEQGKEKGKEQGKGKHEKGDKRKKELAKLCKKKPNHQDCAKLASD